MQNDLQTQISMLKQQIEALQAEYFKGNFSGSQDFNKYCRFNSRLKVPVYGTAPATCEVGELCAVGGELLICSTANTFTVVGTQS